MTGSALTRALDPIRWQRVRDVFVAAIECSRTDRVRVIEAGCGGDDDLRREVEGLLAAHDGTGLLDGLAGTVASAASWARKQATIGEGDRIGRYGVLSLLGSGGMGLVYHARDEGLGRDVALKLLPPHLSSDPGAKQRFLVEARAAAALDDPNVCTIYEIGEGKHGDLFIAMPLYDGETLQARLKRGRLTFDEALPIVLQVARGLGRAHARGIVHRDIKPSNVMRLTDGTVRILDFGIAQVDDPSLAAASTPFGTIAYMSPEQVRAGAVSQTADIWSLGILLHELLTAALPFSGGDHREIAKAILGNEPALVTASFPDIPSGIDAVLRRALAKEPRDRYTSTASFASDLTAVAARARVSTAAGTANAGGIAVDPEARLASERRRAVVLVTRVSDYSALLDHLEPDEASRVVGEVRDLAVEVVRRHGGLVNQAIGEEIVALFGAPVAHEDDELRAVRAAVELHASVREGVGTGSPAVRLQSGLHAGPVVAQRLPDGLQRYAIVGAPAQIAARLALLAGPDDIVLSPECHRLVAPFYYAARCTPIVIEHEPRPLIPMRITGETGLETRMQAAERSGLSPYVGRDHELAALAGHLERASRGQGRVVTVVGEAGSGKSRLLRELRERVVAHDALLLQGRCRAYGDVPPYLPFVEILRDALKVQDCGGPEELESEATASRIRALSPSLEPFLPLLLHLLLPSDAAFPLPRHLQGEQLELALSDALAAFACVLSGQRTLVLLLEDWHWADAASRNMLDRLSDVVGDYRLLLVVTVRPEAEVAAALREGNETIHLGALDSSAAATIMRAVLRVERVPSAIEGPLYQRTGGNPFFLEQVCRALVEQHRVEVRAGETIVDETSALSLPDTVQAVIRSRVDTLEPDSQDVLRLAAVVGRDFEHGLLAATLAPDTDLGAAMDSLKRSGLIQQIDAFPEITYRFTHALTQDVCYDSLLSHQRRTLHERVARAHQDRGADRLDGAASLLAHHFSRAEAWHDAVAYGLRAANRANALNHFADALSLLDHVLEWLSRLPDDESRRDLRADVLLLQERECETLGLRQRQQEIIDTLVAELTPRGASTRLAQAYLREGDLLTGLKRYREANRALTTALRLSHQRGDTALERHALRSVGLLWWHEGRHADALAITESALAIDRDCHDDRAVAGDLINLSNVLRSMGDYARAVSTLEEALAMPALADDPRKLVYALHILANIHRCLDDADAALACLRRADETARTHLLSIQRSFHLTSIAHIDLQQGRIEAAIRTYQQAVTLSRRARHAEGLVHSLRTLGEVLFELGRHAEAVPHLREAAGLFGQLQDAEAEAEMWSRIAVAVESSQPEEAAESWRKVCRLRRQRGDAHGELVALEGVARAARRISAVDSIPAFEVAVKLAATLGETRREAALRNTLGILEWQRGEYQRALEHYDAALVLVRNAGSCADEGLILNSLGVTLMRLNRLDDARLLLEQSAALNGEIGERQLEAHALAALGQIAIREGDAARAAWRFNQALALRRALGDRDGQARLHRHLANTCAVLADEPHVRTAHAGAAATSHGTTELVEMSVAGPRAEH